MSSYDIQESDARSAAQASRRTFYRWREIGKAPKGFHLPNGELRIYRSDLDAWLASLRRAA
ncbi:helix-turn-helix domain-containing protein [Nonomuraea sp. B12E4]|uniref:helix-turn-helix transcriptional regulator n=1 Tax=Nonomuraea sp. B12E4 TaxID=3153564 RepID=UPI00325E27CE